MEVARHAMYVPKPFEETRVEVMHALIRTEPLATIVTLGADGLFANHLPLELDPEPLPYGLLRGHVARSNRMWRDASAEVDTLAIFQGPRSYVTPSWYASKQETGRVTPQWNYVVVHAYGRLRFIEDRAWLAAHVTRLTAHHEAPREEPWRVGDAPEDYIERLLGSIVGFELGITRLIGKWKLSQNRSDEDRAGVAAGLREQDAESVAMAELMDRRR
jgi:transcriptional regulator